MDLRKKNFKKGVDAEDTRRRREDESVQIRKAQKEAQLTKKRMFNPEEAGLDSENVAPVSLNQAAAGENPMHAIMQQLATADAEARLSLTTDIRRLVARSHDAPIQEAIDAGVVTAMVQFLQSPDTQLQFEASWVLTNIASGDSHQTQAVVDAGTVPHFIKLLEHGQPETQEQVVWALANIAGDSPKHRDMLLNLNVVGGMLHVMVQNEGRMAMLRNVTWGLSNLCRAKPNVQLVAPMIPYLARLLTCQDTEVSTDALWAFSYIADCGDEGVQAVIESGALAAIVGKLDGKDDKLLQPGLRAAGNIATGTDVQTTILLQHGILAMLPGILAKSKRQLKKEACWLLSNVTAGNAEQIALVLQHGLFQTLVKLAGEGAMDVRKECVWALANAGMGAQPEQQEALAEAGVVRALVEALDHGHAVAEIGTILDSLGSFLKGGAKRAEERGGENIYCGIIEEHNGLTKLEELQEDANEGIYNRAVKLLTDYFCVEEDAETETEGYAAAGPSNFNFNFAT